MSFRNLKGDEKLIERISNALIKGSVSHAYIFEGDLTVDLDRFSLEFIKAILCKEDPGYGCDSCITCMKLEHGNYEDLYIVEPEYNSSKTVKSIRDEQIEELQVKLKNKPNNERNIALIKECDTLTVRAQNRLLKTLEEPPHGTVMILTCRNMENLLDTVKSRSIKYHVYGNMEDDADLTIAKDLLNLVFTNRDFLTVKDFLLKNVKDREAAFLLLDSMEKVLRNAFLKDILSDRKKERMFKAISLIEEARKDLVIKVSYMNALKNLVLKI